MKQIIALGLVLALTACGGGGGGGGSSAPAAKESAFPCVTSQPSAGKYRAALIDVPHDHDGVTAQGLRSTGLQHVSRVIDRAKCVGFDTIVFQSFIPIDPATGALTYYDPAGIGADRNRDLPSDYWKFVDYAKQQGLRVVVKMVPSNYKDDEPLRNIVPVTAVLDSLNLYYKTQAARAEAHHVDAMHVGHFSAGLDQYLAEWQSIVGNVRSVFSGKLIYATCEQCTNNVIWNLVDIVSISFNPISTPSCSALVTQIVPLYQQAVNSIRTLSQRYQKPIWLDEMDFETVGCNYAAGANDTYTLLMSGRLLSESAKPNYAWQSNSIRAVFETVAGNLSTEVSGMTFGTYMPWSQADWIQNPNNDVGRLFNAFDKLGYSLYNNDQAQFTLEEYLGKPWNHRVYY
jgi:hypothetical protein